jgi:hypothetical protein
MKKNLFFSVRERWASEMLGQKAKCPPPSKVPLLLLLLLLLLCKQK